MAICNTAMFRNFVLRVEKQERGTLVACFASGQSDYAPFVPRGIDLSTALDEKWKQRG
jgi:hypothetical protein